MTQREWQATTGELRFETEHLQGVLRADGRRHAISELVYRPTGVRIDRDMLLALYRLLARSGWMGEARAMAHTVTPTEDGLELIWAPRLAHQVQLRAQFAIREPASIDCTIDVTGHAYYPAYEVFVSSYFAPSFRSGGYVHPGRRVDTTVPLQVQPAANPVYEGLYVTFPRDEAAAHLFTDGRWQRGRHFTRFLPARYYGWPLGFYAQGDGPVDVLVMGLPQDTVAVSMAYATSDPADSVGQHNSLYLSLFGQDLHPGERWRTVVRLVVGEFNRDVQQHQAQYAAFLTASGALSRGALEVGDLAELRGL